MYKQGEIVLLEFPISKSSEVKLRPLLIISKTAVLDKSDYFLACPVTLNLKLQKIESKLVIDNSNLESGNLPKNGLVLLDSIFTLEKKSIKKKIARLDKATFDKIRLELIRLF